MSKLKIKPFRIRITEQEIKEFCDNYKIDLPSDYRKFLLENNGGTVNYRKFKYEIDGRIEEADLEYFVSLKDEPGSLDLEYYRDPVIFERIPEWLLVIGNNGCGDCICLATDGKQKGKLFFWIHDIETEDEYGTSSGDNVFPIQAKNFSDFLKRLNGEEIKERTDEPLYKFMLNSSNEEITKRVKENPEFIYSKTEFWDTPIGLAIKFNRNDLFDLLYYENEQITSDSLLYGASIDGNSSIIEKLLKEKHANVNRTTSQGKTCAMAAAEFGQVEALKTLIALGADLDAVEYRDYNIAEYIKIFCNKNKDEVIKVLAEAKKDDSEFLKKLGL